MTPFKRNAILFLLVAITLAVTSQHAAATAEQFTVPGGEEVTRSFKLVQEDRVFIDFAVVGSIEFYIVCPNRTLRPFGIVADFNLRFDCVDPGEYVLHFSNIASEGKLVTLDYEIQHYVFGIPQMLLLAIVVAVICVCAVAVFVLMGRQH